jgi:hypothetical protein
MAGSGKDTRETGLRGRLDACSRRGNSANIRLIGRASYLLSYLPFYVVATRQSPLVDR